MPKGRIINIEWAPDQNVNFDWNIFSKNIVHWCMDEIKQAVADGCDTIVTILLIDGFLLPKEELFIPQMKEIKRQSALIGVKELVIVSGHGEDYPAPIDVDAKHFIDYTLRYTYNAFKDQINNLPTYSENKDKFLFLGGVPSRNNRIGLLYRFYEKGLLSNSIWSFFPPWTPLDKQRCREILSHVSEEDYDKFLKFADKRIDNIYEDSKKFFGDESHDPDKVIWHDIVDESEWVKNVAWINPKIYEETAFSIISEGLNYWEHNRNDSFVTEKFWRTVFMQQPFLFAGHPDQFRYMKKLGFRTFENYMLLPDYIDFPTEQDQLNAIVINTESFLNAHKNYQEQIKIDVKYNYDLALDYIDKQNEFFEFLITRYGVPREEVLHYFDRKGYEQLIRRPPRYV